MTSKIKFHSLMYGLSLIALGLVGYLVTGLQSVTALIPSFYGLLVLGVWRLTARMSSQNIVLIVLLILGAIGFLATIRGLTGLPTLISGGGVARPAAVISQSIMSVFSLIYTFLVGSKVVSGGRQAAAESR